MRMVLDPCVCHPATETKLVRSTSPAHIIRKLIQRSHGVTRRRAEGKPIGYGDSGHLWNIARVNFGTKFGKIKILIQESDSRTSVKCQTKRINDVRTGEIGAANGKSGGFRSKVIACIQDIVGRVLKR